MNILLEAKECVTFQFLKENQKKYIIKKACKVLKISRYGYFDYLHRRKRSIENEGRYGSRRLQKVLLQQSIKVNEKRVSRNMCEQGLIAKGAKNHTDIVRTTFNIKR